MICQTVSCENEVAVGYKYCKDCYDKWKKEGTGQKSTGQTAVKAWNEDPVVDQLMKINANLGKIAQILEKKQ